MARYSPLLLLLLLLSCTNDPLEVRTVESDDPGYSDDLEPVEVAANDSGWASDGDILTATGPASLELLPAHEALTIALSYRGDADMNARLLLGGRYPLQLPSLLLSDSIEMMTAVQARPGIWQDLEITFLPASADKPALLVAAYLNNNLVYYQQPLPETSGADGPLTLEVESGTVSVTNVRSRATAGKGSSLASDGSVELNLPLIHYTYYDIEGNPDDVTDWGTRTPSKEGYTARFDINTLRERGTGWGARFDGELEVPKAGEYTFSLFTPASTRLFIDDQLVVDQGGKGHDIYKQGKIELSEGTHELRLDHYQNSGWNRLDVKYAAPGSEEEVGLNIMPEDRAVATPGGSDFLELETDDRPYLLRSFLNFPPARIYDYTDKRTHVLNVGEAEGPHYSYDLHNGSLLQAWRGDFVNVGEMWVERGEPQVARALGPVIAFDGKPQWALSESNSWPDSLNELRHSRYELDDAGRPTFYFKLGGGEVSDRIVPTEDALVRTLKNMSGNEEVYTQIAAGNRIVETAPGAFEVRGPGATVALSDFAVGELRLLSGPGGDRLVAMLPAGEQVTYRLDW